MPELVLHQVMTASTTDPLGETVTFAYDDNGNRASATDQFGNVTAFRLRRDGQGRGRIEDPLGNAWAYACGATWITL